MESQRCIKRLRECLTDVNDPVVTVAITALEGAIVRDTRGKLRRDVISKTKKLEARLIELADAASKNDCDLARVGALAFQLLVEVKEQEALVDEHGLDPNGSVFDHARLLKEVCLFVAKLTGRVAWV